MMRQSEESAVRDVGRRRMRLVMIGGAALWLAVAGRLVQVQALQHDAYALRAKEQYERMVDLKASRGGVLDRRGRSLAADVKAVSFAADPQLVDDLAGIAGHFESFGAVPRTTMMKQLQTRRRFVYLARQLSGASLDRARERNFHGVSEFAETKRTYPYGQLAGQVLGHTNIDNRGREGVERAYDELLKATHGRALSYVDARGSRVHVMERQRKLPRDGGSVYLTIDAVYQEILEEELVRAQTRSGAESGMGIIARPRTGEILAMANVPQYDPNQTGNSAPQIRRNRTITDPFEPGSTFKAVTAAAVLEEGAAVSSERIYCEEGELALEHGGAIRDTHPYAWLTFAQVMEKSSNIGIIKFARRLERQRFYEYLRNFGLGIRSGINLPAESAGLLEHASAWSERTLETIAIGQEISVTALQLVQAYGAIANGGNLMAPRIISKVVAGDGRVIESRKPLTIRRVISDETAAAIRDMLVAAVARGTGNRAAIDGIEIAGKTGTAQRAAADSNGYDPDANVVSFIGFLPARDPELLCLIVIDNPRHDRWGGHIAAPAFKRVMERILYIDEVVAMATDSAGATAGQRLTAGGTSSGAAWPRVTAAPPTRTSDVTTPVDAGMVRLPDLRGTGQRVAVYQAEVRGVSVRFFGDGEVVVEQTPAAGEVVEAATRISCRLGDKPALLTADRLPLRQAVFLRNLQLAVH